MISRTVQRTMDATFVVRVPDARDHGFPTPNGTGFFVSSDGLFVTAWHVVKEVQDPGEISLTHEVKPGPGAVLRNPKALTYSEEFDLAVLKFDFSTHSNQEFAKGKDGFDFLEIELDEQYEGTPVYSFGYPLPKYETEKLEQKGLSMIIGSSWICPRVTSAIISSRYEVLGPVQREGRQPSYVLDKAFNYGNSGGPIVLQESGKAIAVVVRFQPVQIPQGAAGNIRITVPSLYGIASSLANFAWDKVRQASETQT